MNYLIFFVFDKRVRTTKTKLITRNGIPLPWLPKAFGIMKEGTSRKTFYSEFSDYEHPGKPKVYILRERFTLDEAKKMMEGLKAVPAEIHRREKRSGMKFPVKKLY